MRYLFSFLAFSFSVVLMGQGQITSTLSGLDIPTSFDAVDTPCNQPNNAISITLPSFRGTYTVTSIDISYSMTSTGSGWISDQRSFVVFNNTDFAEDEVSGPNTNSEGLTCIQEQEFL